MGAVRPLPQRFFMSEIHVEQHSSLIKTPKQLIVVMVLAFAIPVGLIAMLVSIVIGGGDYSKNNPAMSEEAIAKRLQPVGRVMVSQPGVSGAEKSGQEVYETVCAACHATGVLNAPKFGDKAAWKERIAEGQRKITDVAIKGVRQMPARGGNPNLSDTEFARAVVYMANAAGANWKAPEGKPAAGVPVSAAAAAIPATVPVAAPAPAESAKADLGKGKSIFDKTCMACHGTGVAGAPKAGDKAAWAPRIKTGMDTLYATALKGKGAMPPKGGNVTLSEADVKAAVDYMVSLVK